MVFTDATAYLTSDMQRNADEFIKGHIPGAKYARDLDHHSTWHIRDFICLETAPRTLRLVVVSPSL